MIPINVTPQFAPVFWNSFDVTELFAPLFGAMVALLVLSAVATMVAALKNDDHRSERSTRAEKAHTRTDHALHEAA